MVILTSSILPFSKPKISSLKRIGPHNFDILNIIIGSLLGDGSMERDGSGSRFAFYVATKNGPYLLWIHQQISSLGYAKPQIPIVQTRKGKDREFVYFFRFRTFTYSSFNWILEAFYPKGRKIIPKLLEEYLTPLSLAIWIMDDGCLIKNRGLRFSTNSFTLTEIKYLSSLLENKFSLKTTIHKSGIGNQYNIYIPKSSLPHLIKLVNIHMHPHFYYKLGLINE
uniref:LAGLIDADG endonuclease n=1 Tax=Agaricus bitorquis TaxID=5343 RepID=UPI002798262D|nr:LAGLIDADG endonuclease [Agaricus bitorquis]WFG54034.1 LAGLIDADG endonuclease [Agaricus bitorquis]